MELLITVAIISIGIVLFVKEYFSIDTTSLIIMALFIVSGVLSPEEGFSGFTHPATLTLGCMFVVSAAIFKTGIIDGLSGRIIKLAKIHYIIALVVFCLITAVLSAFINDTAVVAIMIPMALVVSKESGINPSKLLIPISFAACFGGAGTLIGTGTNILITSYAEKSGIQSFSMFEFTSASLILSGIGLAYVFFIAPWLLPKRQNGKSGISLTNEAERYTSEITLEIGCNDIGKQVKDTKLINAYNAQIIAIFRNGVLIRDVGREMQLMANDALKIMISPEKLLVLQGSKEYLVGGNKVIQDLGSLEKNTSKGKHDEPETKHIYEMLIPVGSDLAGYSLKEVRFREVYRASVLAVRHRNELIMQHLSELKLREGDLLLVYASERAMNNIVSRQQMLLISYHEQKKINYKKAIPALLIAIGVVAAAALNLTSILMSGMIGCLLIVTTSILKPTEAYQAIEWKVIFMIAGVLSMGHALEKTGGSDLISQLIFDFFGDTDPRFTLSFIFLITFLSTNVISGKATAALMTPIVISLAATLQVSERPFLVAVMFGCAYTFMTPLSNPTNTMVYAPGNYKFNDYLKVGTPLNIVIWIAASFIIPLFFPF